MFSKKNKEQNKEKEVLLAILAKIQNPITGKPLSSEPIEISRQEDGRILVKIPFAADRPAQLSVEAQIRTAWASSPLKKEKLKIEFPPAKKPANPMGIPPAKRLSSVKKVIAISSGKGGVGKSTVTIHLAAALYKQGFKVGVLDADIYGPSLGKMIGQEGKAALKIINDKIIPYDFHGIKLMSFSFFLDTGQAVVWRGPMLGKALEQFLFDIDWGELDFLLVDMPPGTGDAHLSMAQLTEVDGAIIVTTPQEVAVLDAERSVNMYQQVNIPIIGVIENMSEFICPHCSNTSEIFSRGGGSKLAEKTKSPLLSQIPLTLSLMKASESGSPLTLQEKTDDDTSSRVIEAFQQASSALQKLLAVNTP
ncbi:MAG: ATP-binding protein [Candidatus Hydrogenedentota bacterium]|nr:MAG: ATP-binding protein [Candidatus Hydrogenedentota bacterium]